MVLVQGVFTNPAKGNLSCKTRNRSGNMACHLQSLLKIPKSCRYEFNTERAICGPSAEKLKEERWQMILSFEGEMV
jgi:hypothetical protein